MECEAENPTGNLRLLCPCLLWPFVFKPGDLHEIARDYGVLIGGGFVAVPLEGLALPWHA